MRALILVLAFLATVAPSHAAVFCVSTPTAFDNALETAGSNGEDDEIRLTRGTIGPPPAGEAYEYSSVPAESFSIEVSGDWRTFFGFACGYQGDDPQGSIIDPDNQSWGLRFWNTADHTDITVRLLTFVNGVRGFSDGRGAGVEILDVNVDQPGIIKVERNIFLANTAYSGAGLHISGGLIQQVTNNLFLLNHGNICGAADLVGGDVGGIYFTNNTVLENRVDFDNGEAVYLRSDALVYLANNNFWGNDGDDAVLLTDADVPQILRNNNYQSVFTNGLDDSEGNISFEPHFEPGLFNFAPRRDSPLVDAGIEPPGTVSFWYLTDVDLRGTDRVVGPAVDIGAYENDRIFGNGFDPPGPFGVQ